MSWVTTEIDFLPERVRLARARRRRIAREAYLLGICLVGAVLLGYIRQGQISRAAAEVTFLEGRAAELQSQLAVRDRLERQQADLMVMSRITTDLGSRADVMDVLAELQVVMPRSISLLDLSLETMDVHVPVDTTQRKSTPALAIGTPVKKEKIVKRIQLSITGLSPTDIELANFIGQLSSSPLFEDVNMGYTRTEEFDGRVGRQFQASCYVVR